MAYGQRYVKDLLREQPDLLRKLSNNNILEATSPVFVPWSSMSSSASASARIDSIFVEELCEGLLQQIPHFLDSVNFEYLMTEIKQTAKDEEAMIIIDGEGTQKGRAAKLLEYIRDLGKDHIVYKVFASLMAGAYPSVFRSATKRLPTREEAEYFPSAFKRLLKERIKAKEQQNKPQPTDTNQNPQAHFENLPYVKLKIIKMKELQNGIGQGNNATSQNNHGNIFKEEIEQEIDIIKLTERGNLPLSKGKKLLIKGSGGVGKSTTLKYLSDLWLNDKWDPGYSLVLLLDMSKWIDPSFDRLSVSTMDILISLGDMNMSDVDTFFIAGWLMNWSTNIMLLMDGVDEIEHYTNRLMPQTQLRDVNQKAGPLDIFLNILGGSLLPNATVLFASRDFKGLEQIKSDGTVEIKGFTDSGVDATIKSVYQSKPEDGITPRKFLKKNHIVKSFCYLPSNCLEILQIIEQNTTAALEGVETQTSLYAHIITRHLKSSLPDPSSTEALKGKMTSDTLLKLAQMAFNGLFHMRKNTNVPKVVFTENDIREAEINQIELAELLNDQLLISVLGNNQHAGPFRFVHHKVQELLAMALFVGRYSYDKKKRQVVLSDLSNISDQRFHMARLFMYGLAYDKESPSVVQLKDALFDYEFRDRHEVMVQERKAFKQFWQLLKDMCKVGKETESQQTLLELAGIANESRSKDIQEEINRIIFYKHTYLKLRNANINAIDMLGLVSVILSPISLDVISIIDTSLDACSMKVFSKFLANSNRLDELILTGTGSQGLDSLSTVLSFNTSISHLRLDRNGLVDQDLSTLHSGISQLKNLTNLSLRSNNLTEDGLSILAQSLEQNGQLVELLLDDNVLTDRARKAISKCLVNKAGLKILSLSRNSLSNVSCTDIADALRKCPNVEKVNLNNNIIGTSGAQILLRETKRKTAIDLSDNQIAVQELKDTKSAKLDRNYYGLWRVKFIVQNILSGKIYTMLNLERVRVGDEHLTHLASHLIGNADIEELNLADNFLTRRSVRVLNQLAYTCPKLKKIDVSKNYLDKLVIESLKDVAAYTKKGLPELPSTDERNIKRCKKTMAVSVKNVDIIPGQILSMELTKLDTLRLSVLDLSNTHLNKVMVDRLADVLEGNVGLRKLELSNCGLSAGDVGILCRIFGGETKMCETKMFHLGLSSNYIKYDAMFFISAILGQDTSLTSLDLSRNEIDVPGMKLLFEALSKNKKLEILNLSGNLVGKENTETLQEAMKIRHGLRHLKLGSICGDVKAATHIIQQSLNTQLQSLDLSNNKLDETLAWSLGQMVRGSRTIETLDLSENKLGEKGIKALCKGLEGNETLQSLKLKGNCLGEGGAQTLSETILVGSSICCLDISHNGLGSRGVEKLIPGLRNNTTLTSLNISNNMIKVDGAKHIETALKGNMTLTALKASSNLMLAQGAESIAKLLGSQTGIKYLDLSDNSITDTGVYYIVEGVIRNKSLVELSLSKNNIKDIGARELDRGFQENRLLTTLDLSGNWIDNTAVRLIGQLVSRNTTLTSVNLSENLLSDKGADMLGMALEARPPGSQLITVDWTKNHQIRVGGNEALHMALFGSKV